MIPFSYPSPRVSQLDAHILDTELFSLLKEQLASISQLHTGNWSFAQHPELWSLLLQLVVFRLTVWKSGSTYGLALQNLKYSGANGKLIGSKKKQLLLAIIVGTFAYEKFSSYLYSLDDTTTRAETETLSSKVKNFFKSNKSVILSKVDHTAKLLSLVNFTLFLVDGRYSSVAHRALGISLTPVVTDLLKFNGNSVNFEFQNRQLVWNVMTEFLVFTLPLLQLGKLRKALERTFKSKSNKENVVGFTQYTNLPLSECAICHDNNLQAAINGGGHGLTSGSVTNPYITNCGHIYCYVCISTRFNSIKSNGELPCLRCNSKLISFKEFEDVDESAIIVEYEDEEVVGEEAEKEKQNDNIQHEQETEHEEESDFYSEQEEYDEDEAFDL